jgi:hypothetical protein
MVRGRIPRTSNTGHSRVTVLCTDEPTSSRKTGNDHPGVSGWQ